MSKLKVATCSLAGCFGCHMSILDLDERLFTLVNLVEFDRSPLTDVKQIGVCDVGIIEGGVANSENIHVLREFRAHCKILISMGACAITGGVPAMRNRFTLRDCLEESYISGVGLMDAQIDYFLPGCPPSADTIWAFLTQLLSSQPIALSYTQLHYD